MTYIVLYVMYTGMYVLGYTVQVYHLMMWFYLLTSLSFNSVEVSKKERDTARRIYDQEQEKIRETVAFGRRSEGPPTIFYSSSDKVLRSTSGMYKCLYEENKLLQLVQKM